LFGLVLLSAGCTSTRFSPAGDIGARLEKPPATIERVARKFSNVYLLRSPDGVALVDTGSPGEEKAIVEALGNSGLTPRDVRVVVVTHGHADHAGTARFWQKNGAKVVLGRDDELLTKDGKNDDMHPTGPMGFLLKPVFDVSYEPFVPDVLVEDEIDLAPWGLRGVRARRMPGHTSGSLVVLVGKRDVIAGDLVLGAPFGLSGSSRDVGEHYYQHDRVRDTCNVQTLIDEGIDVFHLAHGGSVDRDAVLRWRPAWAQACRR
jgi:glyoxylase-like metal-dependent hydrolase (beta-lactamase superfamily II)